MGIAAALYAAVAITAVSVVPWTELAAAPGPLTEVIRRAAPVIPPIIFTAITLAVTNTALVNYITSSRLLYGMAQQNLLPASFVVSTTVRARRTSPLWRCCSSLRRSHCWARWQNSPRPRCCSFSWCSTS
jgi:amino acid transporter